MFWYVEIKSIRVKVYLLIVFKNKKRMQVLPFKILFTTVALRGLKL